MGDFFMLLGLSILIATCVTFCGSPTKYVIDGKVYCFDCELKD